MIVAGSPAAAADWVPTTGDAGYEGREEEVGAVTCGEVHGWYEPYRVAYSPLDWQPLTGYVYQLSSHIQTEAHKKTYLIKKKQNDGLNFTSCIDNLIIEVVHGVLI